MGDFRKPVRIFIIISLTLSILTVNLAIVYGQNVKTSTSVNRKSNTSEEKTETFKDLFNSLPASERRKRVLSLAQQGYFLNVPEFWKINDPSVKAATIWHALQEVGEPFSFDQLNSLERVYSALDTDTQRTHAAALLYRYGRPSGYIHLSERLQRYHDEDAAIILAQGKELTMLPRILAIFEQESKGDPNLIAALGKWNRPEIKDVLLKSLKRDPDDTFYALYLARQNVKAAIPLIRRINSASASDNYGRTGTAIALIKLGDDKDGSMLSLVGKILQNKKTEYSLKNWIITSIGDARATEALPLLKQVISKYVSEPDSPKHRMQPFANESAYLAVSAEDVVSQMDLKGYRSTATILFRKINEIEPDPLLKANAAKSLLELGGTHADIEKIMGKQWLRDELVKRTLKPLPDYLLPKEHL